MTHACTISFSKTVRIDIENIRATLLKLSLSYTLLVQAVHLTFMHTVLELSDEGGGHRSLSQFYAEHNFIF